MTELRCNNFPCQLSPGHSGPCNSLSEREQEMYSDRERHDYLSQLNHAELFALASEWITLYVRAGTGDLLARVEEYLTEQTDRAYVAYYRASQTTFCPQCGGTLCTCYGGTNKNLTDISLEVWQALGDARELVRRPLREMRVGELKGRRVIDGTVLR